MTKLISDKTTTEGKPEVVKPIRAPKPCELQLRVDFTDPELLELGKKLGEATTELRQAKDEAKGISAQLKAKCDGIQARVDEMSNKLCCGYTMRNVACEVRFDTPHRGMKSTYRLDTYELVGVASMTTSEMQGELELNTGNVVQFGTPMLVPDLKPDAPAVLTVESWDDLDCEELTPAGFTPEDTEDGIRRIRDLIVSSDEEMRTRDEIRGALSVFITHGNKDDLSCFLAWLQAAGNCTPGATLIGELVAELHASEQGEPTTSRTDRDRVIQLYNEDKTPGEISQVTGVSLPLIASHLKGLTAPGKKVRGRKSATNSGTVSLPSDEGSRDDMGADSKNNLG
jgi:hypothetical protein